MKAVVYITNPLKYLVMRFLAKRYPGIIHGPLCMASLKEVAEPKLVNDEWVKIKVTMSGICGSDIGGLNGQESLYLEPYVSKKFILGHENVGIITEVGEKVKSLKIGDRVTVIPFLSCAQRNIKNECEYCRQGDYALCENVNDGNLPAGLSIGWNSRTSGGWSECFISHYSNVVKLPPKISDEAGIMIDSFSCALHAVMQNLPKENDVVLVYGCGTMGLNTIASLRALGLKNKIIAIYSRNFQKKMALKLGANIMVNLREDLFKRITELTKAKIYYPQIGKPVLEGGVDMVYECVANTDTINNSLRFLKAKGRLIMIATAGVLKTIDVAPVWFRELKIIGSCEQGHDTYNGSRKLTYEIVIGMLKEKKVDLKQFVTHRYPLADFKNALKTAVNKNGEAIKVALCP